MQAVKLHTPVFLAERDLERLVGRLPMAAVEKIRTHLRLFQSWVAEPALRKASAEEAVRHVLESGGTAAQFKVAFIEALAQVQGGVEALLREGAEHLGDDEQVKELPALAAAVDRLQCAQRSWIRFLSFHPSAARILNDYDRTELMRLVDVGFHADNLLTVAFIGLNELRDEVDPAVLEGIAEAAKAWTGEYYGAVRDVVESAGPTIDPAAPFQKRTLADLLALPPHDEAAATVDEMDEAIGDAVHDE